jgi:hypothetical protein
MAENARISVWAAATIKVPKRPQEKFRENAALVRNWNAWNLERSGTLLVLDRTGSFDATGSIPNREKEKSMMMRLASAVALAALVSTAAMAQTSAPSPTQPATPPMAQPAPASKAAPNAQKAPDQMAKPAGSVKELSSLPADAKTITNYYKQAVYDPSDNKIGDVADLLVDKDGKISAVLIGVGGFLGIGEKDVAVPFDALQLTQKNNKWYLVMNATKDELKNAPGFKYDRAKTSWIPDTAEATTGMGERAPAKPAPASRAPMGGAPATR